MCIRDSAYRFIPGVPDIERLAVGQDMLFPAGGRQDSAHARVRDPKLGGCLGYSAVHLAGDGIGLMVILRAAQAAHDVLHVFARDLKQRRLIFVGLKLRLGALRRVRQDDGLSLIHI